MSTTGTRPPLFDPEPGSFDEDVEPPRFPRRPTGNRRPGGRDDGTDSPRWVRPFLLVGLVLVAVLSLLSFLGDDGTRAPAAPDDPSLQQQPVPTAAAAPQPQAPAASADPVDGTGDADPVDAVAGVATAGAADADLLGARAFATQFAHDYLNLDESNPQIRQRELRAYLAPGLDPQLGWDGTGTQVAVLTVPVDTSRTDAGVTVTVAAQVTGRDAPRWVHLAVPLAQDAAGRWAVIASPAYVPRPRAGSPSLPDAVPIDDELSSALQPTAEALFSAFATDQVVEIEGITTPGTVIRGLDGQVALVEVGTLQVRQGEDRTRQAELQVTWRDEVTASTLTQRYVLTLVDTGGAWLVDEVTAR